MKLSYRVFWLPKEGSSTEEYEDAFAPAILEETELSEFRCAVADGATETSFSGLWAELLCKAYLDENFDLQGLQESWLKEVSGKELPWYAEQKLASGAFATIAGLELKEDAESFSWTARAIGDSCIFHIRDGKLLISLPLNSWEQFDSTPMLLSSNQAANEGVLSKLVQELGQAVKGDIFYLMTDAISKWMLHREKENNDSIVILESIDKEDQFEFLVNEQRHLKDDHGRVLMPNDDVTWTRIQIL